MPLSPPRMIAGSVARRPGSKIDAAGEEVLIVGATPDAANELARSVATTKGAAFGWHRLTLSRLAFAVAAPVLAARGLAPLSRIGTDAMAARLAHRMNAEGRLSHYQSVAATPGFPRAGCRRGCGTAACKSVPPGSNRRLCTRFRAADRAPMRPAAEGSGLDGLARRACIGLPMRRAPSAASGLA